MISTRRARFPWLLTICLLVAVPTLAASGPHVFKDVRHDTSAPLRALAQAVRPATRIVERREPEIPRLPFHLTPGPDPVAQDDGEMPTPVPARIVLNFDGMSGFQSGGIIPPDTNGAVGTTQFVLISNYAYSVYDKNTGALLLGPTFIDKIWTGFGGQCEMRNSGDPIVLFDKLAHRWLVQQLEFHTGNEMCIAVSTSDDATGSYNRYAYDFDGTTDYPKFGVWPDAYYLSFNFFGQGWAEPCAVDRNAMLAGNAAAIICFDAVAPNFGLLPADLDGSILPPSGAPNHYVELGSSNTTLSEFDFHVDFANPANSTFTGPNSIPIKLYNKACGGGSCIPQPPGGTSLEASSNLLMYRNAYRNFGDHESMVFSHSVAPGKASTAFSAERWYELRATPAGTNFTLYQSGTYQNQTVSYWMGSIGMDKAGDIALGFSASDAIDLAPSIRFTGRVPADPLGKMEKFKQPVKGIKVQTNSARWGDYSSMAIDPVDDCTFWYAQEYGKNGGTNWQSHVVAFKFKRCH